MADDPRAELKKRLGAPAQGLIAKLSDADAQALADLLKSARRQQAEALATAQAHALRFVPGLLRRPLLKLFGD